MGAGVGEIIPGAEGQDLPLPEGESRKKRRVPRAYFL